MRERVGGGGAWIPQRVTFVTMAVATHRILYTTAYVFVCVDTDEDE